MKNLQLNTRLVDSYLELLKNFNDSAKQNLIDKLKKTMKPKNDDSELLDLFGAWESDKSAETIIEELAANRNTNRLIDKL